MNTDFERRAEGEVFETRMAVQMQQWHRIFTNSSDDLATLHLILFMDNAVVFVSAWRGAIEVDTAVTEDKEQGFCRVVLAHGGFIGAGFPSRCGALEAPPSGKEDQSGEAIFLPMDMGLPKPHTLTGQIHGGFVHG